MGYKHFSYVNTLANITQPKTSVVTGSRFSFIKERASAIICIEMFNREYDEMICSFDDAPESRILTPSLTTIHIHTQIMAFTAAHLLMSRIKEPSLDYRVVHTETDLICLDSTKF